MGGGRVRQGNLARRAESAWAQHTDAPPLSASDYAFLLERFVDRATLHRAEALGVECDIRPVDWEDLYTNLDNGEADAAIASIRIDAESLTKADFSSRYYATPARFVTRKGSDYKDIRPETIEGKKVAVARGTGHEAFLKQYFPAAEAVPFDSADEAQMALKGGQVDLVFGDGIGLTFWLNGVTSDGCCEFRGGPYFDAKYFGEGVGIAVKKGNRQLVEILNYGLEQVHASGRYEGLFLRYFPMNFF